MTRWPDAPGLPERDAVDPLDIIEVPGRPRLTLYRAFFGPPPTMPVVRRFSDDALNASIEKVLASLPADTKAAEVNVGFDAQGVRVVGAIRLDAGWSLLGGVQWDRGGEWGGSVSVRREWK